MKAELHTPWSATAELISRTEGAPDAEGYRQPVETPHTVFCNWQDGVSQSEFYLSDKRGLRASAEVEIWKADMLQVWPRGTTGDRFLVFEGVRYKVLRDFPASIDTQTLILTEVIR